MRNKYITGCKIKIYDTLFNFYWLYINFTLKACRKKMFLNSAMSLLNIILQYFI